MKELLREKIIDLTGRVAVSGYEWSLAAYIADKLKEYADDIKITPNGNLIVTINGSCAGPDVLYGVHLDEVGYVIKSIDDNGFLHFGKIGGSSDNIIPGRKVIIKTEKGDIPGVIGVRSTHMLTEDEAKRMQTVNASYVDICAKDKDEAIEWGVRSGCQMVIDSPCTPMKNSDYLVTKAADCRALCAIIFELIGHINRKELAGRHYFVFTAMEEVTTAALRSVVEIVNPDYCYILDTIPAGDVPDINSTDNPIKLGNGPVAVLLQHNPRFHNYVVSHPALVKTVRNVAADMKMDIQEFAFTGAFYSTDAAGAVNSGKGNAVMTIALPRRYSHSPTEVINLNDCLDVYRLVEKLVYTPVNMEVKAWL